MTCGNKPNIVMAMTVNTISTINPRGLIFSLSGFSFSLCGIKLIFILGQLVFWSRPLEDSENERDNPECLEYTAEAAADGLSQ